MEEEKEEEEEEVVKTEQNTSFPTKFSTQLVKKFQPLLLEGSGTGPPFRMISKTVF